MSDPYARGRTAADAVLLAHVGHSLAMGHAEAEQRALELAGNAPALYIALRHLADVAVRLAETIVDTTGVDPAHRDELVAAAIRAAVAATP